MAVYVDNFRVSKRIGRINGRWSHLSADTVEELLEFGERIGLSRDWFQTCKTRCAKPGLPCVHFHFDVVDAKRDEAIRLGAIAIDIRDMGALTSARRRGETWTPGGDQ
jgi:hypothetical protein